MSSIIFQRLKGGHKLPLSIPFVPSKTELESRREPVNLGDRSYGIINKDSKSFTFSHNGHEDTSLDYIFSNKYNFSYWDKGVFDYFLNTFNNHL